MVVIISAQINGWEWLRGAKLRMFKFQRVVPQFKLWFPIWNTWCHQVHCRMKSRLPQTTFSRPRKMEKSSPYSTPVLHLPSHLSRHLSNHCPYYHLPYLLPPLTSLHLSPHSRCRPPLHLSLSLILPHLLIPFPLDTCSQVILFIANKIFHMVVDRRLFHNKPTLSWPIIAITHFQLQVFSRRSCSKRQMEKLFEGIINKVCGSNVDLVPNTRWFRIPDNREATSNQSFPDLHEWIFQKWPQ
jgi:hypothetical protein